MKPQNEPVLNDQLDALKQRVRISLKQPHVRTSRVHVLHVIVPRVQELP